jgi:hypothetical protein
MLRHARTIGIALILVPAITVFMQSATVRPACADELDDDSAVALRSLYEGSPSARVLGEKAAGILVFPNIVKAGFLFGAQFGEGTLYRGGQKVANSRSVAASYNAGVAAGSAGNSSYAMGGIYPTLPAGCISPKVQGGTYYLCGNTWFQPSYGANGVSYRVVTTP